MLIVSKFRDYYDASVGYGIDKSIIYERERRSITSKLFLLDEHITGDNYYKTFKWGSGRSDARHEWRIIGFCGRTYVCLIEWKKLNESGTNETVEYYYGEECLERIFDGQKEKWGNKETREFIHKWHNREFTDFFYDNKVPIFSTEPLSRYYAYAEVVLNPVLSEIKFFRIFDSYTAFQEIQMFISGVIGIKTKDAAEIDDRNKVIQHGFDTKWSFRNPDPPKRKQK